jgi:hypothetical protein
VRIPASERAKLDALLPPRNAIEAFLDREGVVDVDVVAELLAGNANTRPAAAPDAPRGSDQRRERPRRTSR